MGLLLLLLRLRWLQPLGARLQLLLGLPMGVPLRRGWEVLEEVLRFGPLGPVRREITPRTWWSSLQAARGVSAGAGGAHCAFLSRHCY